MSESPNEAAELRPNEAESDDSWPTKATAMVVGYVDAVRNKTTGPALVASRYFVYFLIVGILGISAAVFGFILLIRFLVWVTSPLEFVADDSPWLAYVIIGAVFSLLGLVLWKKKDSGEDNE